jgi:hypothetical protein
MIKYPDKTAIILYARDGKLDFFYVPIYDIIQKKNFSRAITIFIKTAKYKYKI